MTALLNTLRRATEAFAALMMAALFLTFVLQITIRYTARLEWIAEAVPVLDPTHYGWTLEFCGVLWIWIIFWSNAFVVRERDHVTFDILYNHVAPNVRKWFAIVGALVVAIALIWSLEPTWGKFHILRIKKTATLSHLFGDWIRMRDVYAIYALFLIVVPLRYAWRAWTVMHHRDEPPVPHGQGRIDE